MQLTAAPLRLAAWLVCVGALSSGPVAFLVVQYVAPQPPWVGVEVFASAYHPVQLLPYLLGYVLLCGFVLFAAACHGRASSEAKTRTSLSLVFTAVYAAMVFTNYTLQVGFVPRHLVDEPAVVAAVTMANPNSLAWFLEMFGYAAMGVATFVVAPLFDGTGRGLVVRRLLELNGVLSVVGAVCTASFHSWVFSVWGMSSFIAWNVVVVVCFLLIARLPIR